MQSVIKPRQRLAASLTISLLTAFVVINAAPVVWAGQLQSRSLKLSSVKAGDIATQTVTFNFQGISNVGSLVLLYCANSPLEVLPCIPPVGFDSGSATLSAQSGETGFSILAQSSNNIVLTRTPAATGTEANSYELSGIKNPSNVGTFYLRINAYTNTDGTGTSTDYGATVGVITQGVTITTEVPEILNFCVAVSIPGQCDSATGDFLDLGDFHTNSTAAGTTQFMVGTNAAFGYVVTSNGNTMTSGNNIIAAIASPASSQKGQSQFGINLRANTVPAVGANPVGGSGNPTANYNSPNLFVFNNGDAIAHHTFVSDLEKYTVSYIVNINSGQPIGVYNTTLTYVVTATF